MKAKLNLLTVAIICALTSPAFAYNDGVTLENYIDSLDYFYTDAPKDVGDGLTGLAKGVGTGVYNTGASIVDLVKNPEKIIDSAKSLKDDFDNGISIFKRDGIFVTIKDDVAYISAETQESFDKFLSLTPEEQGKVIGEITASAEIGVVAGAGVSKIASVASLPKVALTVGTVSGVSKTVKVASTLNKVEDIVKGTKVQVETFVPDKKGKTYNKNGNFTSEVEPLTPESSASLAKKFLGEGFKPYVDNNGKITSIYISEDGKKVFRFDDASLRGEHSPYEEHLHFIYYEEGFGKQKKPTYNNHVLITKKSSDLFKDSLNSIYKAEKLPDAKSPSMKLPIAGAILGASISVSNQYGNSHFGTAQGYLAPGIKLSTSYADIKSYSTSTDNKIKTGAEQTALAQNTQAFDVLQDWTVTEGDQAKHFSIGDSFGSITAPDPNKPTIAALNNADMQQTVMTKVYKIPTGVKQVSVGMLANFVTNEYPQYVGSQYNDNAIIEIKTGSGNIYQATLFNKELNSANFTSVSGLPSPMSGSGGQTGFEQLNKTINVANGGNLTITVKTANVGDMAVPSATLINATSVK